jgi:HEAT repeat protein
VPALLAEILAELKQGLAARTTSERIEAIEIVGRLGPAYHEHVAGMLHDSARRDAKPAVRLAAVRALSEIAASDGGAAGTLGAALGDPDTAVSFEAKAILEKALPAGPEAVLPALLAAAAAGPLPGRIAALDIIARGRGVRGPQAYALLRGALGDPEPEVRAASVRALATIAGPEVDELLDGLRVTDAAPAVREAVLRSLGDRAAKRTDDELFEGIQDLADAGRRYVSMVGLWRAAVTDDARRRAIVRDLKELKSRAPAIVRFSAALVLDGVALPASAPIQDYWRALLRGDLAALAVR